MRWRRRLLRRQRKNGCSLKQTADQKKGPLAMALERGQAYRRIDEERLHRPSFAFVQETIRHRLATKRRSVF